MIYLTDNPRGFLSRWIFSTHTAIPIKLKLQSEKEESRWVQVESCIKWKYSSKSTSGLYFSKCYIPLLPFFHLLPDRPYSSCCNGTGRLNKTGLTLPHMLHTLKYQQANNRGEKHVVEGSMFTHWKQLGKSENVGLCRCLSNWKHTNTPTCRGWREGGSWRKPACLYLIENTVLFLLCPNHKRKTSSNASAHWHELQTREQRVFPFPSCPNAPAAFFHQATSPSGIRQEPKQEVVFCFFVWSFCLGSVIRLKLFMQRCKEKWVGNESCTIKVRVCLLSASLCMSA